MSCLTPGPAFVMTRIVPGIPPRRGEPMPAPALPLTINCWVSASHQIVALRASNSSLVRYSEARSQILGGSVTWASQSKVAKSLVIGANVCTGMLSLLSQLLYTHYDIKRLRANPPASSPRYGARRWRQWPLYLPRRWPSPAPRGSPLPLTPGDSPPAP